jgi:hypothetical protein
MDRQGSPTGCRLERRPSRRWVRARVQAESLELRSLLSTANPVAPPALNSVTASPAIQLSGRPFVTNPSPQGYTPQQIRAAYGFNAIKGNGAGETIAIVDAFGASNLAHDLNTFDTRFGLAPASLVQVNQDGGTALPPTDSGWALETSLDVEWAHAIAPGAKILVVHANSDSISDLLTAVDFARHQAGVVAVSMSWGTNEFWGENAYDSLFTTPAGHNGVTFVAASGDDGGLNGVDWPAASPNVLSVGGTSLALRGGNSYGGEAGWFYSGGGISQFEPEPSYQLNSQGTGGRTTPDVAFNADPNTGFAVYDSTPYQGQSGWIQLGGTSAGAPQWAALMALADQALAKGSLDGATQTLPHLYSLANGSSASTYFHDVSSGNNFWWLVTPGYDGVTGLGSPVASAIVQSTAGRTGIVATAPGMTTITRHSFTANTQPRDVPAPIIIIAQPVVTATGQRFVVIIITTQAPPPLLASPAPASVRSPSLITPAQVTVGQGLYSFWSSERSHPRPRADSGPEIVAPAEWSIRAEPPIRLPAEEPQELYTPDPFAPMPPSYWRALESLDSIAERTDIPMPAVPQPPALDTLPDEEPTSKAEAALSAAVAVAAWGVWEWRAAKSDRRRRWLPNL